MCVGRNPNDWQLDCIVLQSDETHGELVHFRPNNVKDFRGGGPVGIYLALDALLDRIASGAEVPRADVRLTLARFKNETRAYFSLRALDEYPPRSPETEIWMLINALYEKALKGIGESQ